jgi:hypothetical protein
MTFDPLLSTNENLKLNGFSTKPNATPAIIVIGLVWSLLKLRGKQ